MGICLILFCVGGRAADGVDSGRPKLRSENAARSGSKVRLAQTIELASLLHPGPPAPHRRHSWQRQVSVSATTK
jgi:hypothetical protein